jgi:FAD/FMN-containing dehydrogenase
MALREALGAQVVALPDEFGDRRVADWSGVPGATPLAIVRPRTTEEVARALAICSQHKQPVVTQGGLTGLVGGANLLGGEVALSLDRMNRIIEIDEVSATMTVEAGTPLQVVQEAASAAGFYFPLDLGARGSCSIGGNLATNAGGNRVIKYGMMRDQVLGVEAVLASGEIVGGLNKMIKNNSGYDLRHLLIGSEGTLAVITRVVLRLRPKPTATATAWCGLPDSPPSPRCSRAHRRVSPRACRRSKSCGRATTTPSSPI